MFRTSAIAVLAAAFALAHVGTASAWILVNGGGANGLVRNGMGPQGVSLSGASGATVLAIELPSVAQ